MVSSDSSFNDPISSATFSASRNGSPVRWAVPAIGHVSTRDSSTRTNISGDAPTNCFVAELQEELVGARIGVLDALEQLGGLARVRRAEGSGAAPPHSNRRAPFLAHLLDTGHVFSRRMVGNNRAGARWGGGAISAASRASRAWKHPHVRIVLVVVDLLLLEIGKKDVVAEKQVQVFCARGAATALTMGSN